MNPISKLALVVFLVLGIYFVIIETDWRGAIQSKLPKIPELPGKPVEDVGSDGVQPVNFTAQAVQEDLHSRQAPVPINEGSEETINLEGDVTQIAQELLEKTGVDESIIEEKIKSVNPDIDKMG